MERNGAGTFSILAISPDSKFLGIAVASGSASVGDRVPHAKPRIGVIATQAQTNIAYGIRGLELLEKGSTPKEALDKLLMEDLQKEQRQVAIMDFNMRKATFTGVKVSDFRGEVVGKDYVAIGNLLSGKEVVKSMAKEFEGSSGNLALRLSAALKAGSESGGDKRGEKSVALIVISTRKVETKIKIDIHENPIAELRRRLRSPQDKGMM